MKSNDVVDKLQVTEAVREMVRGRYQLQPNAPIEIKGNGLTATYLLVDEGSTWCPTAPIAGS